jgi:N-acetyl-1-D-myo-inositol-2-amino-2-deoxy-alpha-D-glucopyranoside deacetylase
MSGTPPNRIGGPGTRLLLVHAHPDDETIFNGATMAAYAAAGTRVTLVTCTRGELGEVIPPGLAHLAADRENRLGGHREGELAAALVALGVQDHRFLGAGRRVYRDSGMAYDESGRVIPLPDPVAGAFTAAGVDGPAADLAEVIRECRPQVVVGYEPGGGYGHPDHVHAHRVTMRAVVLAGESGPGGPAWAVSRVFWTVQSRSLAVRLRGEAAARVAAGLPFRVPDPDAPPPSMVVDDALVSTVVDGSRWVAAKVAALRAHETQLLVHGDLFVLSNRLAQMITGIEHYRLAMGVTRRPGTGQGPDCDLFAGLD